MQSVNSPSVIKNSYRYQLATLNGSAILTVSNGIHGEARATGTAHVRSGVAIVTVNSASTQDTPVSNFKQLQTAINNASTSAPTNSLIIQPTMRAVGLAVGKAQSESAVVKSEVIKLS